MTTDEQVDECDRTLTKRHGESQTAFAIRCINAEAWDEGHLDGCEDAIDGWCSPRVGGRLDRNPYRSSPEAPVENGE